MHPALTHSDPDTEILRARCSNAGRWGLHDELGTLNHITPDTRRRAVQGVIHGEVVSLGKDLPTAGGSRSVAAIHVVREVEPQGSSVTDTLTVSPHGFEVTHLDAVGHNFLDGRIYNDRRADEVVTSSGLAFGSVMAVRDGIVTRGVLLDVAAARGVSFLARDDGVSVADLEAAERLAGVRVQTGDAVFIRIGMTHLETAEGPLNDDVRPGVLSEVLPWLHEREVALYSGDCIERLPSDLPSGALPLHQIGQAAMGLAILDVPDLEVLRDACERFGSSTFLLMVAPLRLPGGTGSAVNPLAIF